MATRFVCILMLISMLNSCETETPRTINKFSDSSIRKIADFRDRRMSDSLYRYLRHPEALYRKEAALAFASVQDSLSIKALGRLLLQEKDTAVRRCVAFAIGQTPSSESERIILASIIRESNRSVLSELLESYGKTTRHWQLINPAFFHDSVEAEGLAWSIYRAGLNGKTDSTANRVAGNLLGKGNNFLTRLGAAHYFGRSARDFERQFDAIKNCALGDPSTEVRMAAVYSLRKINLPESLATIRQVLSAETDPRVRVNAVRALQSFDFEETKAELFKAVKDKQISVGIAASEVLKNVSSGENWVEIANLAAVIDHWRIRSNIYEAAIKSSFEAVPEEILSTYHKSGNPYEKAALLACLQNHLPSFDFIKEEFIKADTPVLRTAAANALANLTHHKAFSAAKKDDFIAVLKHAIALGDAPSIGALAAPVSDPALKYDSVLDDPTFLKNALANMSLPQDYEAIEPLEKAIAFLEGRAPKQIKNDFNHPIDWNYVLQVPKEQIVIVKTSRGNIKVRLFVEEAPGSVANFLKLATSNYFDKKPFHRVVPNFVIQGGCKRGDGSGSEDYSIRSEFSHRRYKTGSLGMASSGKDTEGTQWFITHSPTPHLDGRYTVFGEVIEGMKVVELMQVGDKINSIEVVR
jgi:cyclophilin family peptidyl-prolyl cis-trans isomerase/HEAT repeat protein